jgi:hypothetical protein
MAKGNDLFSHWNLELVWILGFEIWTLEFVRDTPLWYGSAAWGIEEYCKRHGAVRKE